MISMILSMASALVLGSAPLTLSEVDSPLHPDDELTRMALNSTVVCANCVCCTMLCSYKGAAVNTPDGKYSPGYCDDSGCGDVGCEPELALGDETLTDVINRAAEEASIGDASRVAEMATEFDGVVRINVDRSAVQVLGCEGTVIAHYPMDGNVALAAADLVLALATTS